MKKMILENALILEAYHGEYKDAKSGKVYPFDQGRIYQFHEDFPRVQLVKLPDAALVEAFKSICGKRVNVICEVDERFGKQKLIFAGVE